MQNRSPRKSNNSTAPMNLDFHDKKILSLLQADCSLSLTALSDAIGLSQTPCWKRIKRMESEGLIQKRVALIDRKRLGYNVLAMVVVRTSQHQDRWADDFIRSVKEIPEVLEFYRTAGNFDYFLKVVMKNIEDYNHVYEKLIRIEGVFDISAYFSIEEIKSETKLPVL